MNSMKTEIKEEILRVCRAFRIIGEMISCEELKIGIINQTYKVTFGMPDGAKKRYMVQSVNTYAFKQPEQIMNNIDLITGHMRKKETGKPALHFHHTAEGKTYFVDEYGFWRLFNYIDSITYNITNDQKIVKNAGEAFGNFQLLLADFDAAQLAETIPDFHNTRKRYEKLWEDVSLDVCGRVEKVREELAWLASVQEETCRLTDLYEAGKLPLRVTHNDTKINNVLFNKETKEFLTVIDLDTVMPGIIGNDFGDAIRYAANFVEEDCKDAELAGVNLEIYEAFADGFLKKTAKTLTETEIDTLAFSSFSLTVELAVRFLDDYIFGDPYFHIEDPEHNLRRARCQIALAKDMLKKMPEMEEIVKKYTKKYQ